MSKAGGGKHQEVVVGQSVYVKASMGAVVPDGKNVLKVGRTALETVAKRSTYN